MEPRRLELLTLCFNCSGSFNPGSLLQLDFYTPFPTNVRQLVRQALPPVRLVRVTTREVSSKLRIQLRLHNHCSQSIQCTNSCTELPIVLSLGC